ncbi:hypothetical protein Acj61p030 [Acinetobacter phage Acj61]|jgi:hypothetical protein|uniref:Uncharacterized protein n=1 Tax=Acinetobacter phage Acj61 TaxID=760732 RepID=E5E411_9CAUD|nr:hypothetical protein Acj61p030 [Acinetobacter phage Acj61]ADG35995.1 hypothetical protein Acj61p030 [Acinetobacter phage Acj61]
MSKFTEKLKAITGKVKTSAKKNPKLYGTILAIVVVASGGSATGVIEIAAILNAASEVISVAGAE